MRAREEAEFRDWVVGRQGRLLGYARRLTGDWHEAEDIVQLALTRLYGNWRRVKRGDQLDAYVKRAIFTILLDNRKSGWSRRECSFSCLPEMAVTDREHDDRQPLMLALSRLPPGQRAALVLRYWDDCSVEEAAVLMNCSTGNVKSQCARGLEKLRAMADLRTDAHE